MLTSFFKRYIKLSSPKLNNMAIVGSVLVYSAVVLMGVDHATLAHDSGFPFVCMVRLIASFRQQMT